jgi:RNA polymerase sigma-54 factor
MARMLHRLSQAQRLQQKADPQLLLTNRILQMSSMELQQSLVQEMAENPALDAGEEQNCNHCAVPGPQCLDCPFNPIRLSGKPGDADFRASLSGGGEEDLDPLARVEAPPTLQEHLLTQLVATGTAEEQRIGRYLISNIDNDGYLRCGEEETIRALHISDERLETVIRLIQTFDPTGVGARSLQECLLIQARALEAEGQAPKLVVPILEHFWKELTSSKLRDIARRLRVQIGEVDQNIRWLRSNLSPYPGSAYRPAWEKSGHRSGQTVRPDVIVSLDLEHELVLEIPTESLPSLNINPQYVRLWDQMRERPGDFSAAELKHIREYLVRAQMFLKSLEDRTSILRQVAECLISEQERYFRSEQEEDMAPLTQSQLASFLRVHESTVSRAVAEKFLQLPSGRIVPFSYFFDRALSYRKLVANIVASEDPTSPYSDQQIADILRRQGVIIARRTVMKYREELNILSSRQRARISA